MNETLKKVYRVISILSVVAAFFVVFERIIKTAKMEFENKFPEVLKNDETKVSQSEKTENE